MQPSNSFNYANMSVLVRWDHNCPTPSLTLEIKKYKIMINSQLNLGFENVQPCPSATRRERRLRRARLWFDHMRFAVESAPDRLPRRNPSVEMSIARSNQ